MFDNRDKKQKRMVGDLNPQTTYRVDGRCFFSLNKVLEHCNLKDTKSTVTWKKGTVDMTNWSKIRYKYGKTKLKLDGKPLTLSKALPQIKKT